MKKHLPAARTSAFPELGFLRECFDYDPESGSLTWKKRPRSHFSRQCSWSHFNNKYAGLVAGSLSDGYIKIGLVYLGARIETHAHRVAYYIHTGMLPDRVDHVDGDRSNNAFSNLRAATHAENLCNCGPRRHNKLGVKGVQIQGNKFVARITVGSRTIHLGRFESLSEAGDAYERAAIKYRGDFARTKGFENEY